MVSIRFNIQWLRPLTFDRETVIAIHCNYFVIENEQLCTTKNAVRQLTDNDVENFKSATKHYFFWKRKTNDYFSVVRGLLIDSYC